MWISSSLWSVVSKTVGSFHLAIRQPLHLQARFGNKWNWASLVSTNINDRKKFIQEGVFSLPVVTTFFPIAYFSSNLNSNLQYILNIYIYIYIYHKYTCRLCHYNHSEGKTDEGGRQETKVCEAHHIVQQLMFMSMAIYGDLRLTYGVPTNRAL